MTRNTPLTIDPTNLCSVLQALPYAPTIVSCPTDHQGVLILHYERHCAHSVAEYTATHHIVPIWGMNSQAQLEAKLDDRDRWQGGTFGNGAAGLIPAGVSHSAEWDCSIALTVIFLHPQFVEQVTQDMIKGDHFELIPKHQTGDAAVTQLGLLLKTDLEEGHSAGRLYRESIATALAVRLIHHHAVCRPKPQSATGISSQRLQIVLNYIQDHLEQDIKLTDLAQLLDLSEYYLCRSFKERMGISLYQYVIQQRVERAKHLLKRKDMTIAHIALDCGFSSHSHLTRHFKRLVGVTPKEVRSE